MVHSEVITHASRKEKCILWKAGYVFAQFLDAKVGCREVTDEDLPGCGAEEVEE
jgi:hypothetical protein